MRIQALLTQEQFQALRRLVSYAETTLTWDKETDELLKELGEYWLINEAVKIADEFLLSPSTVIDNDHYQIELNIKELW